MQPLFKDIFLGGGEGGGGKEEALDKINLVSVLPQQWTQKC